MGDGVFSPACPAMKTALFLLPILLCSCSEQPSTKDGAAVKKISLDRTREVAMHVLLNRHPEAQIVSESGNGRIWTYRFATNGTLVPLAVVVDRKAGKARFEKVSY
jgi:hypothetical protein